MPLHLYYHFKIKQLQQIKDNNTFQQPSQASQEPLAGLKVLGLLCNIVKLANGHERLKLSSCVPYANYIYIYYIYIHIYIYAHTHHFRIMFDG